MPKKPKKKLARERKPFWYDRLNCWYCWVYQGGKRKLVRVAADETEADRKWHEIRAQERSIDRPNPLTGLETSQYEPRDVRISPDEWKALLAAIPEGDEFADFLKCLRATGMRPFFVSSKPGTFRGSNCFSTSGRARGRSTGGRSR